MRLSDVLRLQEEMDRAFREARACQESPPAPPGYDAATDVSRDTGAYHVRMDLPGVPRGEVRLAVQDGALTVTGSKARPATTGKLLRGEREYGRFSRVIPLPSDADSEDVTAKLSQGVLSVRVGRRGPAKQRRIEIAVE